MIPSLLNVEALSIGFRGVGAAGAVAHRPVREVSFRLAPGEVLGLVGESGSGKTLTGLALMGLLPPNAAVTAQVLAFEGQDLREADEARWARFRGRRIGMVFQDPVGSFNPAKTIRWHVAQAIRRGGGAPETAAARLGAVGLAAPEQALRAYPHQLSGGMLQRVLIAMVVALGPRLLIADEPTTNLDNVVEGQILTLLRAYQRESGAALLFITHDLTLARHLCDRIAVMYAGEIVEIGPAATVLDTPRHPYTQGLIATVRSLENGEPVLFEIPGDPGGGDPDAAACRFGPRCPRMAALCRSAGPNLLPVEKGHAVRCVRHRD